MKLEFVTSPKPTYGVGVQCRVVKKNGLFSNGKMIIITGIKPCSLYGALDCCKNCNSKQMIVYKYNDGRSEFERGVCDFMHEKIEPI